uniref:Uncharacterized protein n=1 Tax=Fagus sylvatica TaxID=28930 RepID=A0A2N9F9M4_FAGSY
MVSEGGSWTPVRSEDLPEGLSDRDEGTRSLEETPSISGSSEGVGPEASWTARSYLSKVVDNEWYWTGMRRIGRPLMRELLDRLNLAPGQLAPNAWRTVVGSMVMWKVLSEGKDDLTLDELLFCYKPCQIPASPGFWSLNMRQRGLKLIVGTPSSNREWKDNYVFVCGDNWEGLQCEKDDNFIPPLRRPKLNEDGHNRVLRALHHNQHHYKYFIRPELLALYSFGPEPSEAVLSLQEINQKRGGPAGYWEKRKADSSSKKATEERILPPPPSVQKPSIPEPVPTSSIEVVEKSLLNHRLTDPWTGCRRFLAMLRWPVAEPRPDGAYSDRQSLYPMGGGVAEAEDPNVDMAKKDEDLKKALDGARKSEERVKMLTSQLEGARMSTLKWTWREGRGSEEGVGRGQGTYDDVNTKYFLSGFNLLKKQAKEKFPQLDFDAFQPFDDDESTMPADEGHVEAPTNDPQMDDDATS